MLIRAKQNFRLLGPGRINIQYLSGHEYTIAEHFRDHVLDNDFGEEIVSDPDKPKQKKQGNFYGANRYKRTGKRARKPKRS